MIDVSKGFGKCEAKNCPNGAIHTNELGGRTVRLCGEHDKLANKIKSGVW